MRDSVDDAMELAWNESAPQAAALVFAPSNPRVVPSGEMSAGTGRLYGRRDSTSTVVGAPPDMNMRQAWYNRFLAASGNANTRTAGSKADLPGFRPHRPRAPDSPY